MNYLTFKYDNDSNSLIVNDKKNPVIILKKKERTKFLLYDCDIDFIIYNDEEELVLKGGKEYDLTFGKTGKHRYAVRMKGCKCNKLFVINTIEEDSNIKKKYNNYVKPITETFADANFTSQVIIRGSPRGLDLNWGKMEEYLNIVKRFFDRGNNEYLFRIGYLKLTELITLYYGKRIGSTTLANFINSSYPFIHKLLVAVNNELTRLRANVRKMDKVTKDNIKYLCWNEVNLIGLPENFPRHDSIYSLAYYPMVSSNTYSSNSNKLMEECQELSEKIFNFILFIGV